MSNDSNSDSDTDSNSDTNGKPPQRVEAVMQEDYWSDRLGELDRTISQMLAEAQSDQMAGDPLIYELQAATIDTKRAYLARVDSLEDVLGDLQADDPDSNSAD